MKVRFMVSRREKSKKKSRVKNPTLALILMVIKEKKKTCFNCKISKKIHFEKKTYLNTHKVSSLKHLVVTKEKEEKKNLFNLKQKKNCKTR